MLDFEEQCCDAADYISIGSHCAAGGGCINDLRPLGSVYWFAWPEYIGLTSQAVIYASLLLLAVSSLLAAVVLVRALRKIRVLPPLVIAAVFFASIAIHYFFFRPVLFVSLSDAPAGLLALIGCWLLLLSWQSAGWRLALGVAIGGLLLGSSAWVRSFNLYPLLATLLAYLVVWCFRKNRRVGELLIVTAFIPVVVQYTAILQAYGKFSYISPLQSGSWTKVHLSDVAIGYDTVLPHTGLRYFSNCPSNGGLLGAIEQRDLTPYLCLIGQRINFYWGSDLRYTYITPKNPNNKVNYPERLDVNAYWAKAAVNVDPDSVLAPNNRVEAELIRMNSDHFNADLPKEIFTGVSIFEPGVHTLSVWLWSSKAKYLNVILLDRDHKHFLKERVLLTSEPVIYEFSADVQSDYILVMLQAEGKQLENLGSEVDDTFSAWGFQFEQGNVAGDYSLDVADDLRRSYSAALLGANVVMCLLALALFCRKHFREPSYLFVAMFVVLCFGQALIIVPEQRFIIVPQVIMWLFGISSIAVLLLRKKKSANISIKKPA